MSQSRTLKNRVGSARSASAGMLETLDRQLQDKKRIRPTQEEVQNFSWMTAQEFERKSDAYTRAHEKPCKLNFT